MRFGGVIGDVSVPSLRELKKIRKKSKPLASGAETLKKKRLLYVSLAFRTD
jgi:hypothetical protein